MSNDHLDRAFLLLGDGLGFDAGLNFAVNKILKKLVQIIQCHLLILAEREFLILDRLLNGKRGPFVRFQVEVRGMSTKCFSVNGGEIDDAFVFLRQRFKFFHKLSTL